MSGTTGTKYLHLFFLLHLLPETQRGNTGVAFEKCTEDIDVGKACLFCDFSNAHIRKAQGIAGKVNFFPGDEFADGNTHVPSENSSQMAL